MKDLAAALAKAQKSIKSALKDSKGQIGQNRNYKYADLTSVWDACRTSLSDNGIAVIQKTDFDGSSMWVETVLLHSSGDMMSGRFPLRPTQDTPQAYGSALTYARRYSLASMVGVVTEDDDGASASEGEPRRDAPAGKADDYEERLAKAQKFSSTAIAFFEGCISEREIDAWKRQNATALARLESDWADLFKQVKAVEKSQREFVRAKDAAE